MSHFCLRWNNYEQSIIQVFGEMLETENLVDVTIACDGSTLKAHKVVLAACSPLFQSLFMSNPCKHPIVILNDVRFEDLKLLIEYIYRGEVTVSQDQLPALIKTAETLQIRQLAQVMTQTAPAETHVTGNMMSNRKKRKRTRVKRVCVGEKDVVALSGESDAESPEKQAGGTPVSQNDTMAEPEEMATDAEAAGGTRILELSMAEVVDQNVDANNEETEAIVRNLDASEVGLALSADGEEYDEDKFNSSNISGVQIYATPEEQTLMLIRKKQSFVWEHFTETGKGSVKCKKCSKLLSYKDSSGSTSNMIKHLKTVHAVERIAKPPLQE